MRFDVTLLVLRLSTDLSHCVSGLAIFVRLHLPAACGSSSDMNAELAEKMARRRAKSVVLASSGVAEGEEDTETVKSPSQTWVGMLCASYSFYVSYMYMMCASTGCEEGFGEDVDQCQRYGKWFQGQ